MSKELCIGPYITVCTPIIEQEYRVLVISRITTKICGFVDDVERGLNIILNFTVECMILMIIYQNTSVMNLL